MTAQQIVDGILDEGWLSAGWEGVKRLTGIGHDSFGLGKNSEKGWKPKYGAGRSVYRTPPKQVLNRQRRAGDTDTWDLDK